MSLFKRIVSFATAWINDKMLFSEIEKVADDARAAYPNSHLFPRVPSVDLFYAHHFKHNKGEHINSNVVEATFELLEEKFILTKNGSAINSNQGYALNEEYTKWLYEKDLLYNHLLGFRYIINKYENSVVKIVVRDVVGDISIGTGWYAIVISKEEGSKPAHVVITNDHVVDKALEIKVLTKNEVEIPYHGVEQFQDDYGTDMAIIMIDDQNVPDFNIGPVIGLLEEIITIGYPSIPNSREAYQVVHKGEINAYVQDYTGQELLVISARTSPGHSGSPVLNDMGQVVGMVAKELFEKNAFINKGITPYFACITAHSIHKILMESKLIEARLAL
jgi:S1-C subfamily serine protease